MSNWLTDMHTVIFGNRKGAYCSPVTRFKGIPILSYFTEGSHTSNMTYVSHFFGKCDQSMVCQCWTVGVTFAKSLGNVTSCHTNVVLTCPICQNVTDQRHLTIKYLWTDIARAKFRMSWWISQRERPELSFKCFGLGVICVQPMGTFANGGS